MKSFQSLIQTLAPNEVQPVVKMIEELEIEFLTIKHASGFAVAKEQAKEKLQLLILHLGGWRFPTLGCGQNVAATLQNFIRRLALGFQCPKAGCKEVAYFRCQPVTWVKQGAWQFLHHGQTEIHATRSSFPQNLQLVCKSSSGKQKSIKGSVHQKPTVPRRARSKTKEDSSLSFTRCIGRALEQIRKNANLTQDEVACRLSHDVGCRIYQSYISKIESAHCKQMTLDRFALVCKAFGKTPLQVIQLASVLAKVTKGSQSPST